MLVAQPIVLVEDVRRKLGQRARGRATAAWVVVRSRILLRAAFGLQNELIAASLKDAPRMVALWRGRFLGPGARRVQFALTYTLDVERGIQENRLVREIWRAG